MSRTLSRSRARICAAALLTLFVVSSTPPHTAKAETQVIYKVGALVITAPWVRPTPEGARVAGGYMTITNTGSDSDRLIGGSAVFAGRFEVHEMTMADGVMRMRELADGLEIKPGQTVELKPGGLHVMFVDLKTRVKSGIESKGQLTFLRAGSVAVEFRVALPDTRAPASQHKH